MTETKTTEAGSGALLEVLLGLLVPLLMSGGVTDLKRARLAAQQAIEEYRSRTQGELVMIGQIIAFAMTAMDNLRLSMAAEIPLSVKLRLRANANALSRASVKATERLDRCCRAPDSAPEPTLAEWTQEPDPAAATAPEPVPSTLPIEEQNRRHWANAMATAAAELQARTAQVPSAQRRSDQLWVEVLGNVAGELRQPSAAPTQPGRSKAELFRSTLMAGGGFPDHLATGKPSRHTGK
jgi:hypothetical protein